MLAVFPALAQRWRGRQQGTPYRTKPQYNMSTMAPLEGFFAVVYLACVIAIIVYVIRLVGRFVSAHERIAVSLEMISRKLRDDAKP
jgi:hypothetical protein